MQGDQWAILGILGIMLVAYASERFRIELVAMAGLAGGWALGVVPVQQMFSGFASPAVITVVEILLVVSALSQSRVVDDFARRIIARTGDNKTAALAVLCGMAALVSVVMNNIGALVLLFPVALSLCARLGIAPGRVLMPLSFATLLGGLCSLTGTPANLVVNEWKLSETGSGFGYFELALIGGPVAVAGLVWVVLAAPRVFRGFATPAPGGFDAGPSEFLAELTVPPASPLRGRRLPDAEAELRIRIHGVIRNDAHVFARRTDITLAAGDRLLVEAGMARLARLRDARHLSLPAPADGAEHIEVVVMPDSLLLGSRIGDVSAFAERGIQVVALASRRHRTEGGFANLQIGLGDVLVLSGSRAALHETLADCGLLPLSRRRPLPPDVRAMPAVAIFAAGVLLCAFNILPPQLAFGLVVIALVATGSLDLRAALQDLNWPVVILLACMIPLGQAVQETGAAQSIANLLAVHLPAANPLAAAALVLLLAVAITPFIDNVSTAVILSPIAADLATRTGVAVEPLLMAVAVGASLDFLTPFGHHNNMVVMGAGGYRFRDFPRLGAPLLVICVAVALAVLAGLAI